MSRRSEHRTGKETQSKREEAAQAQRKEAAQTQKKEAAQTRGNTEKKTDIDGSAGGGVREIVQAETGSDLKNRQKRNTVILLLVLLGILSVLFLLRFLFQKKQLSGPKAVIEVNGNIIQELPLNTDITTTVGETGKDYNTVQIRDGQISVSEADCPTQVCVMTGWIRNPGEVIACLPHNMIIYIEDEQNASKSE